MPVTITRQLAWSAATDAGNRNMRAAGRSAWDEDDYNTAAMEFEPPQNDSLMKACRTIYETLDRNRDNPAYSSLYPIYRDRKTALGE